MARAERELRDLLLGDDMVGIVARVIANDRLVHAEYLRGVEGGGNLPPWDRSRSLLSVVASRLFPDEHEGDDGADQEGTP